MKRYIFIALVCLLAVPAFATRQIQDKLNYEGRIYEIGGHTDFPLEDYFRSCPKEEQVKKYKILSSHWTRTNGVIRLPSTACQRGYIASWSIETNVLYLTKLEVQGSEVAVRELAPIFGDRINNNKLKSVWFNGPIRIEDKILVLESGELIKTLSPDKETVNKVYKDLKKKYAEQKRKNSQQHPAPYFK